MTSEEVCKFMGFGGIFVCFSFVGVFLSNLLHLRQKQNQELDLDVGKQITSILEYLKNLNMKLQVLHPGCLVHL